MMITGQRKVMCTALILAIKISLSWQGKGRRGQEDKITINIMTSHKKVMCTALILVLKIWSKGAKGDKLTT